MKAHKNEGTQKNEGMSDILNMELTIAEMQEDTAVTVFIMKTKLIGKVARLNCRKCEHTKVIG